MVGCAGGAGRDVACRKDSTAGRRAVGGIEQLEAGAPGCHVVQAIEKLGDDNWRVEDADQRRPSFGDGHRARIGSVGRQVEQHAGGLAIVLYQGDCGRQGRLTGVDGVFDRGAATRFRSGVEAHGAGVARPGFDQLDDVEIVMAPVHQLADGELRRAVGTLVGNKSTEVTAHEAMDQPKAAYAGELMRQVARFHITPELAAPHFFLNRV